MKTQLSPANDKVRLDDDKLTETQAQEQECPMSLAWYRRMRLTGGGPPFIRISNRIFYKRADLRAFMADRENSQ